MEWMLRFAVRHEIGWLENLLYRWRCPYPIIPDRSAKACIRAGHCGCDNAPKTRNGGA